MTKADQHSQGTHLVKDLQVGTIYRDALSGYLVLVRVVVVPEYRLESGKQMVERTVGWMWNPVLGRHQEVELHDHQLIDAAWETSLMPDTRYEKGNHGRG